MNGKCRMHWFVSWELTVIGMTAIGFTAFASIGYAAPEYGPQGERVLPVGRLADMTPDGNRVLIATQTSLIFWDVTNNVQLLSFPVDAPEYIALSDDGLWGLSSKENLATVWNLQTGQRQCTVDQIDFIYNLHFLPDGNSFVTIPSNVGSNSVNVWHTETGNLKVAIPLNYADENANSVVTPRSIGIRPYCIPFTQGHYAAVSSDGRYLFAHDRSAMGKWNVSTGEREELITRDMFSTRIFLKAMALYSNDCQAILQTHDETFVRCDFGSPALEEVFDYSSLGAVVDFAVSPNGRFLALSLSSEQEDYQDTLSEESGHFALVDLQTGQAIKRFGAQDDLSRSIEFTDDGQYLLTCGEQTDPVRIWNLSTLPASSSVLNWENVR